MKCKLKIKKYLDVTLNLKDGTFIEYNHSPNLIKQTYLYSKSAIKPNYSMNQQQITSIISSYLDTIRN